MLGPGFGGVGYGGAASGYEAARLQARICGSVGRAPAFLGFHGVGITDASSVGGRIIRSAVATSIAVGQVIPCRRGVIAYAARAAGIEDLCARIVAGGKIEGVAHGGVETFRCQGRIALRDVIKHCADFRAYRNVIVDQVGVIVDLGDGKIDAAAVRAVEVHDADVQSCVGLVGKENGV